MTAKTVILVKRFKMKLSTLLFYGCIDFKVQPLVQEVEMIPVASGLLQLLCESPLLIVLGFFYKSKEELNP